MPLHYQQKHNVSDMRAVKGCCLDFTRPCEVPVRPEVGMNDSALAEFLRSGVYAYQTDFYWPYGGTGFFLSAGLIETVQGSGDGWDLCREMFDEENTDVQVRGHTISNQQMDKLFIICGFAFVFPAFPPLLTLSSRVECGDIVRFVRYFVVLLDNVELLDMASVGINRKPHKRIELSGKK